MNPQAPFIPAEQVDPATMVSYMDASLILGTTHNRIRILTAQGVFKVVAMVWVRPNVAKMYIDRQQVEAYNDKHKTTITRKVRMTKGEWKRFAELFGEDKVH